MKKTLVGVLCAATMLSASVPALAAEEPKVISPSPAVVAQEFTTVNYDLKINGKVVDLKALKIVKSNDKVMVPLRLSSETLGFKVVWNEEKQSVHMDDGKMQTDIYIGDDNYFAYSSKAIGMTAPTSLGVAPTIIDGSTYVPVDAFKIYLTNPNCVSIKDDVISISEDSVKPDSTQIPNPLVSYSSLEEARKAVGFAFMVPAALPDGYKKADIIVIDNRLAEIIFKNGDKKIIYRTANGTEDISGDYTVYNKVNTITIGNIGVTAKGNDDSISLATWSKDGVSFSLSFDEAVSEKTLSAIIESIK